MIMLINEVSKITNLTKKAIEYYIDQKLIFPRMLDNGYRDFNENDVECLKKISVLRKLNLSIDDIKEVLKDETGDALKKIALQYELKLQRENLKNTLLHKLSSGKSYSEVSDELLTIEKNATITEKLLDVFPGYYGRFITLHFAHFLNEPIITQEQKQAYEEIINFLDNVPTLDFPKELQSLLDDATKNITTIDINKMNENTKNSIENPEKFLSENKEILDEYLNFIQSDEYKTSPLYQLKTLLIEFNKTNGFYDIFIPAMKKLSSSYREYYKNLENANEKLYTLYPEAKALDSYTN